MKVSLRFTAAMALAIGIHFAFFFMMPGIQNKARLASNVASSAVTVTMQAVKPVPTKKIKHTPIQPKLKKNAPIPAPKPKPVPKLKQPPPKIKKKPNPPAEPKSNRKPDPGQADNKEPLKKTPDMTESTQQQVSETSPSDLPETVTDPHTRTSQTNAGKENKIFKAIPVYKSNPLPRYPRNARRRGFEGTVQLRVHVSDQGVVTRVELNKSSGHDSLDEQALLTVKQWLFEPGKINGHPTDMWVEIPIKFQIE